MAYEKLMPSPYVMDGFPRDREALASLARTYGVTLDPSEPDAAIERLLRRIDVVPVELALVQAAAESGWGTSRFAREGNNLYGQWCFKPGCGIVPRQRPDDAYHEVAAFRTPAETSLALHL